LIILSRPGVESAFTPSAGIVQACRTSVEEINICTGVLFGIVVLLSVSSRRKSLMFSFGFMNESNSKPLKSLYSYDQYHWCPMVLIVIGIFSLSSDKYNSRNEGNAIKIRITPGKNVHKISSWWFSF